MHGLHQLPGWEVQTPERAQDGRDPSGVQTPQTPETTSWGSEVLGSADFINYLLPRARARYVSCTPFWTIWGPDLDHGLQAK